MPCIINRRDLITSLPALAIISGPHKALAHRLTTTETRVDIDVETGRVEVTHTLHIHDAEIALAKAGIIDSPDLVSLKERAQMALYIDETFKLFQNDAPVELTLLGAELDKRNVLIFQEGLVSLPFVLPLGKVSVMAEMMRSFVPHQINNVDVAINGSVTSLQFRGADGTKKLLA